MSCSSHLAAVVLGFCVSGPVAAESAPPAAVFRPVVAELRNKVQIPVLLPSKLPAVLRSREITDVRIMAAAADSYSVDLHYKGVGGDAGFAAFFSGAGGGLDEAPAKHPIRLANGALAAFSPVSCGGSCSPANLWWHQGGVLCWIKIALPSTAPVCTQAKVLVETANAMVRVQSLPKAPGKH